jgi:Ca2+-binding EF-hand superfamily protein
LEPGLGDEQLKDIIEEVDEDGSGTIDYDGKNTYMAETGIRGWSCNPSYWEVGI